MRRVILTVPLVLVVGCGGLATEGPSPSPAARMTVGIVYAAGGRGDKSYNESAAFGLDKARAEFGLRAKELAAGLRDSDAQRAQRFRLLAESGCDPVIGVGFIHATAVKTVAAEFPRVRFAIVDDNSARAPNITNLLFADNEGSFLVGAAGALKSRTGKLGFIGGADVPHIRTYEVGYRAGATHVKPKVRIQVKYLSKGPDLSGFRDPALAGTVAHDMYQSGVDIIYQVAGRSGSGVFEAALAQERWAIGSISDQAKTATPSVRENILTSMVKKIDVAVFDFIASVVRGKVRAGPITYDLKAGAIDYTTTGSHIRDFVPRLNALKRQIINGTIKVPTG
ncbi:BMP family ABC transporter substrate-binding protein [Acrocarpospora sp. B8E8]|uniref:BMP family lipoprotein n=1 Tax=Acrocarpospora sp. B8E8 TaxID=3153572 RepID=UPI00325CABAF